MKLLIVMVTFNRQAYSARTLESLLKTIKIPFYLVIVDNASTDGTRLWLADMKREGKVDRVILNDKNLYPGKACNMGWEEGLEYYPEATHLMRLDNDMQFEKGWDKEAETYFKRIDRLGQLGLDFLGGENKVPQFYNGMGLVEWPGCVGGPCIIRREIFDEGARYDETPWEGSRTRIQEDSKFSRKLKDDGWLVGHMDTKLSWTFADKSNWKDYPEYYKKTFYDRDYDELVDQI